MNEHTEQNINDAINWLQQTGGAIQDFATTQAPLYCQEVVAWTFWQNMAYTSIGLFLLILCALSAKQVRPAWREYKDSKPTIYEEPWAAIRWSILTAVFFVFGLIFVVENIGDTIKAKVAPRLVIVEHLRGLNK
jgi:cytochrome c biogenesis factor